MLTGPQLFTSTDFPSSWPGPPAIVIGRTCQHLRVINRMIMHHVCSTSRILQARPHIVARRRPSDSKADVPHEHRCSPARRRRDLALQRPMPRRLNLKAEGLQQGSPSFVRWSLPSTRRTSTRNVALRFSLCSISCFSLSCIFA